MVESIVVNELFGLSGQLDHDKLCSQTSDLIPDERGLLHLITLVT